MSGNVVNHPTVVRSHKGKPSVRVSIHVGFLGSFVLRSDGLTTFPFINLPPLRMLLQNWCANTGACDVLFPSPQQAVLLQPHQLAHTRIQGNF